MFDEHAVVEFRVSRSDLCDETIFGSDDLDAVVECARVLRDTLSRSVTDCFTRFADCAPKTFAYLFGHLGGTFPQFPYPVYGDVHAHVMTLSVLSHSWHADIAAGTA